MREDDRLREILTKYKVVAIVGLSSTLGKASHRVGAYLKNHGFQVIPVNPNATQVFGEKSYSSLLEIPPKIRETIEIVDVFRKSSDVLPIVEQAVELKALVGRPFVVWMQKEIVNEEAARLAEAAGLVVVMDKCMMVEHQRLVHVNH